jgi:hypothetical protein
VEVYAKEFWLPKRGSSEAEYEDSSSIAKDNCRFAVADGAAETTFSRVWAKQLVRAFTKNKLSIPIALHELEPLQNCWQKIVRRRPLPWYAEEKANNGAFAAFLGLELSEHQTEVGIKRKWQAIAVGDCCLVQVRGNEIIIAFPLADSRSFTSRPNLLSSLPSSSESVSELYLNCSGSWGCEDVFLLMTDALACWFFKEQEQGNEPWNLIRDLDTYGQVSFEKLVTDLRSEGRLKNDDVTLVRIDVLA